MRGSGVRVSGAVEPDGIYCVRLSYACITVLLFFFFFQLCEGSVGQGTPTVCV